jgi:HEAT repeat protein
MSKPIGFWIESLRDRCFVMRCTAARALGGMGTAAEEAVPALLTLLADAEAGVRTEAIEALAAIGTPARDAVPALVGALNDPNSFVRRAAVQALKQIEPAVPTSLRAAHGASAE